MKKLLDIVQSIKDGMGWVALDYLHNQVQDGYKLSNLELLQLTVMLAKEDMLVDDNSIHFNGDEQSLDEISSLALIIIEA